MTQEQVETYTRISPSGKPVTVRAHTRANNEAAEAAVKVPGRPPMASHMGKYAGDRVLPGVWADELNKKAMEAMENAPMEDDDAILPPAKTVDEAVQRILAELDRYEGPEVDELRTRLRSLPTDEVSLSGVRLGTDLSNDTSHLITPTFLSHADDIVLALRKGRVSVTGYWRRTKNGLVHVRPYNQIRDLISLLGGPKMAASKGVTTNLMQRALNQEHQKPSRRTPNVPNTPSPSTPSTPKLDTPSAPNKPTPQQPSSPDAPSSPQSTTVTQTTPEGWTFEGPATWPQAPKENNPWDTSLPGGTRDRLDEPVLSQQELWDKYRTDVYGEGGFLDNPYSGKPSTTREGQGIHPYTLLPFDLKENEQLKVNKETGTKAAFTPDGEMTATLTPDEKRADPPKKVDSSQWVDVQEDSTLSVAELRPMKEEAPVHTPEPTPSPEPASTPTPTPTAPKQPTTPEQPSTPEPTPTPPKKAPSAKKPKQPTVPAISDNKIFTHSSGKKFYLGSGDVALKHKSRKDSYLVVGSDGQPKMRISPTGKKFTETDSSKLSLYQALPGSEEATVDVPEPIPVPRPARRERLSVLDVPAPEQPTRTKGTSTPETPSEERTEAPTGTTEAPSTSVPETVEDEPPYLEFDSDRSRSWNYGVAAAMAGKSSGAQAWQDHTDSLGSQNFSQSEFRDGMAHYQMQNQVHGMWKENPAVLENTRNFTFDKNLFPEAHRAQVANENPPEWTMPDVNDNDSWRSGHPAKDSVWSNIGYKTYKPGFNQKDSDIMDTLENLPAYNRRSGQERRHTIRAWDNAFTNGWNDAKKEWELAHGVKSNESEEWNKGYQFKANGGSIPAGASNDFKRGFNEASSTPPAPPTQAPNRTLTPEEWITMNPEDKGRFVKHPHVKEVMDAHGNTWTRSGQGTQSTWKTGETGSRDYKNIPTASLIQEYLEPPKTLSASEVGDWRTVPTGSTVQGNGVSVTFGNNTLSLNGRPLEPSYRGATQTYMKREGTKSSKLYNVSKAAVTNQNRVEKDLDTSLTGLPNATKTLFANNVFVENPRDKSRMGDADVEVKKADRNSGRMPTLHLPQRFKPSTPKNDSDVSVDDENNQRHKVAVADGTGRYLKELTKVLLDEDEQRDMYKDMRDAVLSLVPQDRRSGYADFTPRDKSVKPNDPEYEFFKGMEFVKASSRTVLPESMSSEASDNTSSLVGQSWANYQLSSEPNPVANRIGEALQRATRIGVNRFDARMNNRDHTQRYNRTRSAREPAPVQERLQDRMKGAVSVDRTTIEAGDISVSRSNDSASTRRLSSEIPSRVTKDSAHDMPELANHLRQSGTGSIHGKVDSPEKAVAATQLGYDFSDNDRENIATQLLQNAREQRLSATEERFWNSLEQALDTDDRDNLPTPQDVVTSGPNGKRILQETTRDTQWEAMMGFDTHSRKGAPEFTEDVAQVESPHGIEVDAGDQNDAKEMYSRGVTRLQETYTSDQLSSIADALPAQYERDSFAETIAAAAVDYQYGTHNPEALDAQLALLRDDLPESPNGIEGYSTWMDSYNNKGELKGVLQNFSTTQGVVNDRLRNGENSATSRILDKAFRSVPGTSEDMILYVSTDRQSMVPPGTFVKDSGYLKATERPERDDSSLLMSVEVPKGTKLLHDGHGYIMPRDLQFQVDTNDTDNNFMDVTLTPEPRNRAQFVKPPTTSADVRDKLFDLESSSLDELFSPQEQGSYSAAWDVLRQPYRHDSIITPQVTGAIRTNGGVMNNLRGRLPTMNQTKTQIEEMASEMQRKDPSLTNTQAYQRAARSIKPQLRYTATFKAANYRTGVDNSLAQLKEQGYTIDSIINRSAFGEGSRVTLTSPFGSQYTIDFHTTDSRIRRGLMGQMLTSAMIESSQSMDLDSTEMQMASFVVRNTVVPPGAELLAEGLAEGVTSMPMPPPPPPPPTTPPEMKESGLERRRNQNVPTDILAAIMRLDAKTIAEMYYGIGIPPQVWFALLERYNGNPPPELLA